MITSLLKIIIPTVVSFLIGGIITPRLTTYFYSKKLWRKVPRIDTETNPTISAEFKQVTNTDEEIRTPRVGGIIIWLSVLLTALLFFIFGSLLQQEGITKLSFLSRNQTLLPLFGLLIGAVIGLYEDFLEIRPGKKQSEYGWYLSLIVVIIGLFFAWWFYEKLGVSSIAVPFGERLELGIFFIPFFILVMLGTFSSRVIDGIDGLAGGVMAVIFAAFAVIAYGHNQIDIAALCSVISGATLVFLWFNIPPARFYMGETGMLSLTVTLTIIAFLTDSVLLLPIIGLPLMATALSSAIQISSKKYFKKKIFKVAPLHHHFEAIGWSRPKITMRYWIITLMCAIIGIIISFLH